MADPHNNFAYSLVATAPSPSTSDTTLTVTGGQGALFPAAVTANQSTWFNATIWPANQQPTSLNAEIVRVTNRSTDTFTIVRKQEGSSARDIQIGDQIAATITAKTLLDVEVPMATYSPYIFSSASASSVQTLASASSWSQKGSLLVFPITVNQHIVFNQAVVPVSMSYQTSSNAGNDAYYSYFGLFSMNASTALSRFATGSFSIGDTYNSVSRTWSFPTTTNTSGYGYDSLAMTATAEIVNYFSGTRWAGLQFGSEMHLTPGIYYMGLMSIRSTGNTGNSSAGIVGVSVIGQPIDAYHAVGSVSGYLPIGSYASLWSATNVPNSTNWWGRHMVGFVTATSIANFGGTTIPASIALTALGATQTALTATILPAVSFYSNSMT